MSAAEAEDLAVKPAGYFWWRHGTVISRNDSEKMRRGELPLERAAELNARINEAVRALNDLACPGVQDWMNLQRARN